MNELIKITELSGTQVVSAKELHQFLCIKSKASDWIKNRIKKYGLIEDIDFVSLSKILENGGKEIDYALTLDCAKELAMVEGNSKGKEARLYFIACEKKLTQILKPLSTLDILEMTIKGIREQSLQLDEFKKEVSRLSDKIDNIQVINAPIEYMSIMGHARNIHLQISLEQAKVFGAKCRSLCNQQGFFIGKIPDPRFGTVNTYPLAVLQEIIKI